MGCWGVKNLGYGIWASLCHPPPIIRGNFNIQISIAGLLLITSLLLHHVHESQKEIFLRSALPLSPPQLNPGHGHQNVADIRGGNRRNNSSVQLSHLFTYEAPASPTPTRSVGGNLFPQRMHLSHVILYIHSIHLVRS